MRTRKSLTTLATRTAVVCVFGGLAAFTTSACASASAPPGAPARLAARRSMSRDTRPSNATLTAADLARLPEATNAYEAVRYLRPLFLRPRPGASALRGGAFVAVYVNDAYAGGVDVLQSLPTTAIESMRYLQRTEALAVAGTSTPGDGFIMVTLKNMGR